MRVSPRSHGRRRLPGIQYPRRERPRHRLRTRQRLCGHSPPGAARWRHDADGLFDEQDHLRGRGASTRRGRPRRTRRAGYALRGCVAVWPARDCPAADLPHLGNPQSDSFALGSSGGRVMRPSTRPAPSLPSCASTHACRSNREPGTRIPTSATGCLDRSSSA